MSRVISLDEAARRTGLTKRQIGDKIAKRELAIERDPVTGEKGIYPHTLRGVNGYQPPEPAPQPKPPSPPPPEPEPWTPSAGEMAALIRLDQPGRDAALAELMRRYPEAREYFRDNPLPPIFRAPDPPPPTPPPEAPYWKPPDPPKPTPQPKPRPVPDTPQVRPVSFGWLLRDVLGNVLLAVRKSASKLLVRASRSYLRLAVIGALLFAGWLWLQRPTPQPSQQAPVIVFRPSAQVVRPVKRHHGPPAAHRVPHPAVPSPSPYPLPPLLPPGAGRPELQTPH